MRTSLIDDKYMPVRALAANFMEVQPTVLRRLFHRTKKSYEVTEECAAGFESGLSGLQMAVSSHVDRLELWCQCSEELLVKLGPKAALKSSFMALKALKARRKREKNNKNIL